MSFEVRDAARSNAKPLIGLQSESGAGKTYTSLLLARGFVGAAGKIVMIETESGRGEAYADKTEYPEIGGYKIISLRDDFSPENYGLAIVAAEKYGADALIVDSASHEWAGKGGVLDMAAQREADGKKGMLIWQKPKIDHQRHFMLKFMQTPIPLVILNMRAKYPMIVQKGKDPVRSTVLEPIQAEDILFEMFVHGWIEKENHAFHPTKVTAKSLRNVFVDGQPITLETGRKLAEWAKGGHQADTSPAPEKPEHVKIAEKIVKHINGASEPSLLRDYMSDDALQDLTFIKEKSEATYSYVYAAFNKKIAELENGT